MNTKENAVDHERQPRSMWVQPLALIEDLATHTLFLDPRFRATPDPTTTRCMELVTTEAGLLAIGPTGAHRLGQGVAALGFLEVVAIEERARPQKPSNVA